MSAYDGNCCFIRDLERTRRCWLKYCARNLTSKSSKSRQTIIKAGATCVLFPFAFCEFWRCCIIFIIFLLYGIPTILISSWFVVCVIGHLHIKRTFWLQLVVACCIFCHMIFSRALIWEVKVKIVYVEFSRDLEKDVVSETSGYFRRVLVSVLTAGRDESSGVDSSKAEKDAQDIYAVLIQPFCSLPYLW